MMNALKRTAFFALIASWALSCSSPEDGDAAKTHIPDHPVNGKWLVEQHMDEHIREGHRLLSSFVKHGDTAVHMFASTMEKHNDKLIASCSMKGVAHDTLHAWLQPHIALTSALKQVSSPDEAMDALQQLEASFVNYTERFAPFEE